jgi:hypothetical protein
MVQPPSEANMFKMITITGVLAFTGSVIGPKLG